MGRLFSPEAALDTEIGSVRNFSAKVFFSNPMAQKAELTLAA